MRRVSGILRLKFGCWDEGLMRVDMSSMNLNDSEIEIPYL